MRTIHLLSQMAILVSAVAMPLCASAASVTVTVPGTSNPWLAGMPAGTTVSGGDSAPAQAPVDVVGLALAPGGELVFSAIGGVVNDNQSAVRFPPDGEHVVGHEAGAESGIATIGAPIDCLLGVFLGPDRPDLTPAPVSLDFSTMAARDFIMLSPLLKQVFFIGDGFTSEGQIQRIMVPTGATRLFLGTMDGGGWFNNAGEFTVTVTGGPCTPRKAKATAQVVNGFVVGATITDGGCGYTNAPVVSIEGGGGSGAMARAIVTDSQVSAIQIISSSHFEGCG